MRKQGHYKAAQKPPKIKKWNRFHSLTSFVLVLVVVFMVTGCSNGKTNPESEVSSQESATTSTVEPTPTPEPTPTKAFSDGAFQVSCVNFVPLYEEYLQESLTSNQNLVMKRVEDSDTVTFQLYKGDIDAGITMSFTKNGNPAGENEIMDSISLLCAKDSLNSAIWPSAFAVLNQTIQPDLSFLDCANQLNTNIQNMSNSESKFSYEIGGVTYQFQMYTGTLFSFTATTNPESLSIETDFSTSSAQKNKAESTDAEKTTDSPELVTDHQAFVSDYTSRLKILATFQKNYKLTVDETSTETGDALRHSLNGQSTNVLLQFTTDGIILTSPASEEVDYQTMVLASAVVVNTLTPSVGSVSDCANFIEDMASELQETQNNNEEIIYRTVGNVQYGIACPGLIIFFVTNS